MPDWTRPGHALQRSGVLRRRGTQLLVLGILVVCAAFLVARFEPPGERFTGTGRAADGDSLRLGGDRIRLTGLDAPELDQSCWRASGEAWPCGRESRDLLASVLADASITCAASGVDRFGRFLATCESGGRDIGALIVSAGLAVARDDYTAEERAARNAGLGLWSGRFTDPRSWRDDGPQDDPGFTVFGVSIFDDMLRWFWELTGATPLR